MLYRNGLIMYDYQTESLWSHILGQGISGQFKGLSLTFIPALQTDWKTWQSLHPDTLILEAPHMNWDTYAGYYESYDAGVLGSEQPEDGPVGLKEYVIGVRLNQQARAYPFSALNKEPVVNDEVGDMPVVVFFDVATASGTVFSRKLTDEQTLTFNISDQAQQALDIETGSQWNIFTGEAIAGPLTGTRLEQIPITYAFWFGWADYHAESTLYQN